MLHHLSLSFVWLSPTSSASELSNHSIAIVNCRAVRLDLFYTLLVGFRVLGLWTFVKRSTLLSFKWNCLNFTFLSKWALIWSGVGSWYSWSIHGKRNSSDRSSSLVFTSSFHWLRPKEPYDPFYFMFCVKHHHMPCFSKENKPLSCLLIVQVNILDPKEKQTLEFDCLSSKSYLAWPKSSHRH